MPYLDYTAGRADECRNAACKATMRESRDDAPASAHQLKRCFMPPAPNRVLCREFSAIRIQGGCNLARVTDVYLWREMRHALETRHKTGGLLLHSDQRCQLKSRKSRALLCRNGVMVSMRRRGNGLDNSPMYKVLRSLKRENAGKG